MRSLIFPSVPKLQKIIIFVTSVLLVCFALFLIVLHPIIGNPFIPIYEYEGIKYFEDEIFREFEKGAMFVDIFSSISYVEDCKITDFYYTDNKTYDSIIYGKRPDVYALDLNAGLQYSTIKAEIINSGTYCGTQITGGNRILYYSLSDPNRN